jgi:predicted MFS family arabinose efflux permease
MLVGSVAGGFIAQATDLGVPYLVRAAMLGVTLLIAWWFMHDLGFSPARDASPVAAVRTVVRGAVDSGFRNPPVRWLMLASPFTFGVGIYAFYATQPYLLELYGDETAYGIAGLAAALIAAAQIVGGLLVSRVRRLFSRRTHALILGGFLNVALLVLIGVIDSFALALVLLAAWALIFAFEAPLRQAFINGLIPSEQRATVLSFDALLGSAGGVVAQPALGRTADVYGYPASYVVSGALQALAVPFALLARRENAASDPITDGPETAEVPISPSGPIGPSEPVAPSEPVGRT